MRTTLEIPEPILREVKTRAIRQGVTFKKLLGEYIAAGLNASATQSVAPLKRQRSPIPVAIPRISRGKKAPALSNQDLSALLDREDANRFGQLLRR